MPRPAKGILGSEHFEGAADRFLKEHSSPSLGSPHIGCALREHLFSSHRVVDALIFGQVLLCSLLALASNSKHDVP